MFLWFMSWLAIAGEVAFGIFSFGKYSHCVRHYPIFTLLIATGLYYLAELIEEYSVIAKRVITSLIIVGPSYAD